MALRINKAALEGLSEAEREAVAGDLARVEAAFKANPLLNYFPHSKQQVFHGFVGEQTRLFFGGNRSGKTTATMVDTIVQAVDREFVPERLLPFRRMDRDWNPPFYGRVVTPDLTGTSVTVVHQKFREWCPPSQLKGGSFDRAFDKVQRILWFKNGSWIQFMSCDQDRDRHGGVALHRVVFDEEPRQDIRQENLYRLIDYDGDELFGMTPLEGLTWMFDEFYEPWEKGQLPPGTRVVLVDMDDNPHLSEKRKQQVLDATPEDLRQARKQGRFIAMSGLIYNSFERSKHCIPTENACPPDENGNLRLPAGVEVFCGIDPGIRHMCAVVFCYLDALDRLVVFDEIASQGQTIREVCTEIKIRCLKWGINPYWYVIDPASKNRNNQTGRSDQQEFFDNGIKTIPGQNAVTAGINRIKERLEAVDPRTREPAPRLFVAANCSELLGEFRRYRWVKDSSRREDEAAEAPVKKDDHLLDALRYVVMQRPLKPDPELAIPNATWLDRALRDSLKSLRRSGRGLKTVDHPAGPDIFQ